jgi:hypothetical protein
MNLSINDNHYPPKGLTFFGGTLFNYKRKGL